MGEEGDKWCGGVVSLLLLVLQQLLPLHVANTLGKEPFRPLLKIPYKLQLLMKAL